MRIARILVSVFVLFLLLGVAAPVGAQVDPATVFELEGDIVDAPANMLDDWVNLNCESGFNPPSALIKTGAIYDGIGPSIYTQGGSKDTLDVSNWRHKDGNVPDKDEIINAYAAQYASGGSTILVVGGDRYDNSGAAYIGAWFFQNEVVPNPDGTFDDAFGDPAMHADGDILILANFLIGGSVGVVKVFKWVGGDPSVCPVDKLESDFLCDITPDAAPITTRGFINSSAPGPGPQTIPCPDDWSYTPKGGATGDPIPDNSFFEVGIDLSVLDLGNVCFSSFLVETRSSPSVTAQLKDFVLHSFAPCSLECSKSGAPTDVCYGESTTYTYSADNPGGIDLYVVLDDDNGTPANTADDICLVPADGSDTCMVYSSGDSSCSFLLPAGETKTCTQTVTLPVGTTVNTLNGGGSPSEGGTLDLTCSDTASVEVHPNPTVTINQFTCNAPATSFMLNATVVGGTGTSSCSWNSGDATCSITKSTGGHYEVTVTDAEGCQDTAFRNVGYCTD